MSRPINKEWMNENDRVCPVYIKGVEDFLEFANTNNVEKLPTITCPCKNCRNKYRHTPSNVRKHLIRRGIDRSYSVWALHGEKPYKNLIDRPPVEDVHGKNIEEENIEVGELGMENLVDASYGMHEESQIDDESGQAGVAKEPHAGNEKYNEYRRLSTEKLYPSSSSDPPTSESSRGKATKEKMKVIIEEDGSFVGEYAKAWSTRTGDFVRALIPISYEDIRKVPKNFKDDVWNSLMGEFELNVPPAVARPLAEQAWPQKFRTWKASLRTLLKKGNFSDGGPKGVDPIYWKKFVENESHPKKQEQTLTNSSNRKQLKCGHTLGRRSYAQKHFLMNQENPGTQVSRVDKWLAAHEHNDGTVLESAKSIYDEVKAAGSRRKSRSLNSEDMCEDLESDELAEVFGKECKGGVRGVGSHISKKQLVKLGVAKSKIGLKDKANKEDASFKDEIISRLNNFEDKIEFLVSKLEAVSNPPLVSTPLSDLGSNSVNRSTHLAQNLSNVFPTTDIPHFSHSMPTPTGKPSVILCDKFGKELAKGFVETNATANTCHFKPVSKTEKKVYIEEVMQPDACLWDPPQNGHETLAGFVEGGYVIWLECWLNYV